MTTTGIRTTTLPSGESVPVLGQGTWGMAEGAHPPEDEAAALNLGLDLGMTLLDTAEMYANGAAEELVGQAIASRRDEVFLVSKVLPSNATRRKTVAACERSLKRLKTDRIDLYLLHWRGGTPLEETLAGFAELFRNGLIRHWGVSNFNVPDLEELVGLPNGAVVQTDQVLYNLTRRGVEYDLLPWCHKHNLPVMAYSPIEQGRMLSHPALQEAADRHDATPAQVALAWLLRQDGLIVIPKASSLSHVQDNRAALDLQLTEEDFAVLGRAFPPPTKPQPLEML